MSGRHQMRLPALTGLFLVITVALLGIGLVVRAQDVRRIAELAYTNCVQIEELKKLQRQEARASYRSLERNLRLLGIEKSPQIVGAARDLRDRRLKRFAADECKVTA